MASAVDRTIGSSMGNLSKRIKLILKNVTTELKEEIRNLEFQKKIAETGRDYHMKSKKEILKKCERLQKQLDVAKKLARNAIADKEDLTSQLAEAEEKIDKLQAQLQVASTALDRMNETRLRF